MLVDTAVGNIIDFFNEGAQDTQVLLIAPVEGEPELYSIYLAFDTSPEWIDGWLQLDFCGLVPALSTADSPIPSMHRSENGPGYPCLGQVVIQGINAGGVTQTWWLNDFVFEYDSFAEDAWFSSVSGDIGTTEEYEDPAVLFFSYLIQLREDGSYEMTDAGLSYGPVQVQPYDGAAPEFMLRPAEEFHPFVVFMLEESDTGGHYYMLPYEQAAHR